MPTPAEYIQKMQAALYNDTETMEFYIALSELMTDRTYYGTMADVAVALRSIHNYIIDKKRPDGQAGLITALSEGSASVHYWNKVEKGRYSDLQMTHFGQRLLSIMKSIKPAISVSGDDSKLLSGRAIDPDNY